MNQQRYIKITIEDTNGDNISRAVTSKFEWDSNLGDYADNIWGLLIAFGFSKTSVDKYINCEYNDFKHYSEGQDNE